VQFSRWIIWLRPGHLQFFKPFIRFQIDKIIHSTHTVSLNKKNCLPSKKFWFSTTGLSMLIPSVVISFEFDLSHSSRLKWRFPSIRWVSYWRISYIIWKNNLYFSVQSNSWLFAQLKKRSSIELRRLSQVSIRPCHLSLSSFAQRKEEPFEYMRIIFQNVTKCLFSF